MLSTHPLKFIKESREATISVGIFVMKKGLCVFFLLKAKTHLILLDDTINMKKN